MRLPVSTQPPVVPSEQQALLFWADRRLSDIAKQVNGITEGNAYSFHGASTAAPTTGNWAIGDEILNSAPAELGGAGNKYTIRGWRCTASGAPGTWLEERCLTGN